MSIRVLECIPLWIRGDYSLDNIIKNFIRELETRKRIKWNSITNHCNNLKEELIDGFDSRLDKPEERISKLEDNSVEGVNENTEKKLMGYKEYSKKVKNKNKKRHCN